MVHLVPASAADLRAKPVIKAPRPTAGGFWTAAEYLLWSAKGDKLPPLVTTSPLGTPMPQAGVLGAPGTSVVFGNNAVNDHWRSGMRLSAGYWFDSLRSTGMEAQFFILGRQSTDFTASSGGSPILAQPFFNAFTGLPDASLIAFPGLTSGSVAIHETSRLLGAGAAFRMEFCRTCAFGSVSGLIGYRYLRLQDSLSNERTNLDLVGDVIAAIDQFNTRNTFHGLDLGLTGEVRNGLWKVGWAAKVALGGTFTNVDINGATVAIPAGGGAILSGGGLYALPTNIGSYGSSRFGLAPELAANMSYQLGNHLRAFVGYNVLYWTGLIRPGGTIDTTLNPTQLAGAPLVGPARPQAQFNTTDYWAQGVNLGVTCDF
jgi:hypothetical protein